jgi:shikimate dehydrogenase
LLIAIVSGGKLGVVNIMRRNSDGTWHGDNFDGPGFVKGWKTAAMPYRAKGSLWLAPAGQDRRSQLAF